MARPGEEHHLATLTEGAVRKARELKAEGLSIDAIMAELNYPCARDTLWQAVTRRTWKHVR